MRNTQSESQHNWSWVTYREESTLEGDKILLITDMEMLGYQKLLGTRGT